MKPLVTGASPYIGELKPWQLDRATSQRRTIEQERAQQAWHNIEQIRPRKKQEGETEQQRKAREKEEKRAREYSSRAKSLPSMIQTNGLGATLAFLRAKAGTEHTAADYKLYEHIASRIIYYLEYSSEDVMDMIRNADTSTYRRATKPSHLVPG